MYALAFFAAWPTTLGEGRWAGTIEESIAGTQLCELVAAEVFSRGVDVAPAEDLRWAVVLVRSRSMEATLRRRALHCDEDVVARGSYCRCVCVCFLSVCEACLYDNPTCNNCPLCRCRSIVCMLVGAQQHGKQQVRAASLPGEIMMIFCNRTVDDEGHRRQVHDYDN